MGFWYRVWVVAACMCCVWGNMVPLRVVHELPTNTYHHMNGAETREDKLSLRMKPAGFSGPEHLISLKGKCFKHRDTKYEYVFCPFQNITQEDIQSFYEPYKGVLGVWLDWEIRNNTFGAMRMVEGSPCGSHAHRSTRVELECGPQSSLVSVTEPEKCRYLAKFESPEVCGTNALVVYPRLPAHLRDSWDLLETDRTHGELTDKGYTKQLNQIFVAAGYVVPPDTQTALLEKASAEKSKSCHVEVEELRQRVVELEEELRLKEEYIHEIETRREDV